jgi:8-oxo-dGTP diphosphatase
MANTERPKVGVGVIIKKENKVLLGKRKNVHGEGTWGFPGGHLEFKETIEECAIREVAEETNLHVRDIKIGTFTNDIFENENKHYITIFTLTEIESGEVKIMEPEKCEKWEWFDWNDLPDNIFMPMRNLIKTGFNPFE